MSETNNKNLNNNDTESQGIPKWVFLALLAVILGVIAFAVIKLFIWNLGTAETEGVVEGDFSVEEVQQAMEAGYVSVSLGARRLRTETAALSAVIMANLVFRKV